MSGRAIPRFSRTELAAYEGALVGDLLDERTRLLFVGINPGLWTAAVNAHFARGGNRFWPALHRAGILPTLIDARGGMSPDDAELVLASGIGITNLVPRASARADELSRPELIAGGQRLVELVHTARPRVVAVLGLTAYRQAFARRDAIAGAQPAPIGESQLWVLPNPSGLNAHETIDTLAVAYRAAADAAGLLKP